MGKLWRFSRKCISHFCGHLDFAYSGGSKNCVQKSLGLIFPYHPNKERSTYRQVCLTSSGQRRNQNGQADPSREQLQHHPLFKTEVQISGSYCSILATDIAAIFANRKSHRRPQKSQRFLSQEKAMLHCNLRVRWKVASDLRFRAAICEPNVRFLGFIPHGV